MLVDTKIIPGTGHVIVMLGVCDQCLGSTT